MRTELQIDTLMNAVRRYRKQNYLFSQLHPVAALEAGLCEFIREREKAAAAQEREECAKEIESIVADWPDETHGHSPAADGQWLADYIRNPMGTGQVDGARDE